MGWWWDIHLSSDRSSILACSCKAYVLALLPLHLFKYSFYVENTMMIFFSRKKYDQISNVYLSTADDLTEKIKQDIASTVPWKFPAKIGKIISAYKDYSYIYSITWKQDC